MRRSRYPSYVELAALWDIGRAGPVELVEPKMVRVVVTELGHRPKGDPSSRHRETTSLNIDGSQVATSSFSRTLSGGIATRAECPIRRQLCVRRSAVVARGGADGLSQAKKVADGRR